MQIVCPHCSCNNKIEYAENIACEECKKTLAGHTYKRFKKPFISAATVLLIGGYGAYKMETELIGEDRYPVGVEYELIDGCTNSSGSVMNTYMRTNKTELCICALKETMSEMSFQDMKESEPGFLARFRKNITSCS